MKMSKRIWKQVLQVTQQEPFTSLSKAQFMNLSKENQSNLHQTDFLSSKTLVLAPSQFTSTATGSSDISHSNGSDRADAWDTSGSGPKAALVPQGAVGGDRVPDGPAAVGQQKEGGSVQVHRPGDETCREAKSESVDSLLAEIVNPSYRLEDRTFNISLR